MIQVSELIDREFPKKFEVVAGNDGLQGASVFVCESSRKLE